VDEIQAYFKHDIPGEARTAALPHQSAVWLAAGCPPAMMLHDIAGMLFQGGLHMLLTISQSRHVCPPCHDACAWPVHAM